MDWIMNYVNFQSRLRRNFSGSVNFKAVFSSDSVNVARPLSKTTTKSMSQPILLYKSCSNQKILADLLLKLLKLVQQIRDFYIIKLISEPLTLRLPWASRLRPEEKSWGALNFWGQNLLKSVFQSKTFFNWRPLIQTIDSQANGSN